MTHDLPRILVGAHERLATSARPAGRYAETNTWAGYISGGSSTPSSFKIGPRISPNRLHASSDCKHRQRESPVDPVRRHAPKGLRRANRKATPSGSCRRSTCGRLLRMSPGGRNPAPSPAASKMIPLHRQRIHTEKVGGANELHRQRPHLVLTRPSWRIGRSFGKCSAAPRGRSIRCCARDASSARTSLTASGIDPRSWQHAPARADGIAPATQTSAVTT
jgi:hypothetical protein